MGYCIVGKLVSVFPNTTFVKKKKPEQMEGFWQVFINLCLINAEH